MADNIKELRRRQPAANADDEGATMDNEANELRRRQTELVQALAVESSSVELARLSTELEEVSRKLEQGGPRE